MLTQKWEFSFQCNISFSDNVPEELWMEVSNIEHKVADETITHKKKKTKKVKWLSEEALQIMEERIEVNSKEAKKRYIPLNGEFQRIERRTKKAVFNNNA